MAIQTVSFDIWQTLLRPNPKASIIRAGVVEQYFGLDVGVEGFRPYITTACKYFDCLTERDGRQYGLTERVVRALREFGYRDIITDAQLTEVYEEANEHILQMPELLPSLTEPDLAQIFQSLTDAGVTLAVTSNTGMTCGYDLGQLLDRLGVGQYVTCHVFSDEVGAAKPSLAIFDELRQQSGCRETEILHVGDNAVTDLRGALAAGLCALLYDPQGLVQGAQRYSSHRELPGLVRS